jgi:hypothetical protein
MGRYPFLSKQTTPLRPPERAAIRIPGMSSDTNPITCRLTCSCRSQDTLSPMAIPRARFSTVSEDNSREVDSQPPGMVDHWRHIPSHRSSMEDQSSNHPCQSQQPSMRPQTPQSVHSWWSDSNSIGATISIHAAAKPLIRLMYHRQATNYIEKNRGAALSPQTMDIYARYLASV